MWFVGISGLHLEQERAFELELKLVPALLAPFDLLTLTSEWVPDFRLLPRAVPPACLRPRRRRRWPWRRSCLRWKRSSR